jgi:hypothetical protein
VLVLYGSLQAAQNSLLAVHKQFSWHTSLPVVIAWSLMLGMVGGVVYGRRSRLGRLGLGIVFSLCVFAFSLVALLLLQVSR